LTDEQLLTASEKLHKKVEPELPYHSRRKVLQSHELKNTRDPEEKEALEWRCQR